MLIFDRTAKLRSISQVSQAAQVFAAQVSAGALIRLRSAARLEGPRLRNLAAVLLPLLLVLSPSLPLQAQLTDVTCGGKGDPSCTAADLSFFVANTRNPGTQCDYGLAPVITKKSGGGTETICTDITRDSLKNIFSTSDPRGFVIHEQEQAIGADVPLNLVNVLGTHNSYSNYSEGLYPTISIHFDLSTLSFDAYGDPIAADQHYSISDQLNAGAREIRIDPYFYDGQMRVCHGGIACPEATDGRLFIYVVREIADWLKAHPGEFVTVWFHDDLVTDSQRWMLNAPIQKYLAPLAYLPTRGLTHTAGDPNTEVWPTLRQLRSAGFQTVLFSDISLPNDPVLWSNGLYWAGDTQADSMTPGKNIYPAGEACFDSAKVDTRTLPLMFWNKASEDRSGSATVFNTSKKPPFVYASNEFGLLDDGHVNIAAHCGTSVIDMDFWGAEQDAFHFSFAGVDLVDFRGPSNDDRPLAASWSYAINDSFTGPAVLSVGLQQWVSNPAVISHPYACAAQRDTLDNRMGGLYDWAVTTAEGPWSGGEAACQALGSQYHFWFPQSVYEQNSIIHDQYVHNPAVSNIWLNYRSTTATQSLISAPGAITVETAFNTEPPSQTLWIGGGNGTRIRVQNGYFFQAQIKMVDGLPTNQIVLTPLPGRFQQFGLQQDQIEVQEIDPATGETDAKLQIPVTVNIPLPLQVSPTKLTFTHAGGQVIQVNPGLPGETVPFSITGAPSWLTVTQEGRTAPSQVKVVAQSQPAGTYTGSFVLKPTGAYSGQPGVRVMVEYVVP